CRDVRSDHLLHAWEVGRPAIRQRITPCQWPPHFDSEDLMTFAHVPRNAKLARSSVDEIHREPSSTFAQRNDRGQLCTLWPPSIDQPCHLFNGRILDEVRNAEFDSVHAIDFTDQPDEQKRMSSQLEKVVVYADLLKPEDLAPRGRQCFFRWR